MEFGSHRKRNRPDFVANGNGGIKKSRPELESFPTGVGSKSKPCSKFFSTIGCQFGEKCHFQHYIPGGYKAVSQMMNLGSAQVPPPARNVPALPSHSDIADSQGGKTKLCKTFNTAEGCKFGDKCHFAHGEWELGRAPVSSHEDRHEVGHMGSRMRGRMELAPATVSDFGVSASAKISIDAAHVGAVIGVSGSNSKQISRVTGVKLAIRDHDSDSTKRNVELEGTFDQIKQASSMVEELIRNTKLVQGHRFGHGPGGSNNKTKAM
ncbi:unnamed protein product [Amaranthus hypochondriacus]